jgi:transposase
VETTYSPGGNYTINITPSVETPISPYRSNIHFYKKTLEEIANSIPIYREEEIVLRKYVVISTLKIVEDVKRCGRQSTPYLHSIANISSH